jgi:nucleotide-binding universal stress UspA family protein
MNMKTLEAQPATNKLVSIKKVLVAVDLSVHSEATASYAAELAKGFDASLTIVHVHEPVPVYECGNETTYTVLDDQRRNLKEQLDDLMQKVRKTGLACDSVYLVGEVAAEISALARDIDADLIVTASHHPTFLGRLFNMHRAPRIMHRAPCPVLIYQDKDTS